MLRHTFRHLSRRAPLVRAATSAPVTSPDTSRNVPLPPAAPADLFEDDLMNALFSPSVPVKKQSPAPQDDVYLFLPSEQENYRRQMELEENVISTAVDRFRKMIRDASSRGDVITHRPAADLLAAWFGPLALSIRRLQKHGSKPKKEKKKDQGRNALEEEVADMLKTLEPEAVSVIAIHCALSSLIRNSTAVTLPYLAFGIGNAIMAEVNMQKLAALRRKQELAEKRKRARGKQQPAEQEGDEEGRKPNVQKILNSALARSNSYASAVNYAAQQSAVSDAGWDDRQRLLIGTTLIDLLLTIAKVESEGKFIPAFEHFITVKRDQKRGMVRLSEAALRLLSEDAKTMADTVEPKHQPMIVRPKPWVTPEASPYLRCHAELVRMTPTKSFKSAIGMADLSTLYEGLNALGETAWTVNKPVLDVAEVLWEDGGGIAGLVTKKDVEMPEKDAFITEQLRLFQENKLMGKLREGLEEATCEDDYEFDEKKANWKLRMEKRRVQKMNRELISLRADTAHKIEHARRFSDERQLWLPHNVDFRGRAYPIPVHLQHMGCDLTRAMLTFGSKGVELGPRGLYWLKVHLANKLGADKLSLSERVDFAEDHMSRALDAGTDPLAERNIQWWANEDDPFQLISACFELARAAGRWGGEKSMEGYASNLPISMDGSCNGLQHYAAMGRDVLGAEKVNMVPSDRPQDVYSAVADVVKKRINEMAEDGDELGKLLQGKITRKVVKQTVMTSVYGVTLIGAREQISNRLKEIDGFPENKIFPAAKLLARLTLSSLGVIVSGATETMDWLQRSAVAISRRGREVEWISPIGLPVMQPYRQGSKKVVKTLMQRVTLDRAGEHSPVSGARQRSAFAPNYVHSVDSSHMLMTAIQCKKQGIEFAAVHDSFWTHAARVDEMNTILREEFIQLHKRDLLNELREGMLMRYPECAIEELPEKGALDMEVIRDSTYFFS